MVHFPALIFLYLFSRVIGSRNPISSSSFTRLEFLPEFAIVFVPTIQSHVFTRKRLKVQRQGRGVIEVLPEVRYIC